VPSATARLAHQPWTACVPVAIRLGHHLHRDDPGRNGNDGVAGQHGQGRNQLAHSSIGGDVAVAHGGDGDNGPVDTLGYTGKAIVRTFHYKHQTAKDSAKHQYAEEKHRYFAPCRIQRAHQKCRFIAVANQLHNTENPHHSQQANNNKIVGASNKNRQITGNNGEQINNTIKTEYIAQRSLGNIDPHQVFDGKQQGKTPFHIKQHCTITTVDHRDGIQHHRQYTGQDSAYQQHIEKTTRGGIGAKNDDIELFSQGSNGHR